MDNATVCTFDGSWAGLLTIVHGHYYEKWRPVEIVPEECFQQRLDACYVYVDTDTVKAGVVQGALGRKISLEASEVCYAAFLSEDAERFFDIYRFIIYGLSVGREIVNYTHDTHVWRVMKAAKTVLREAHYHKEFLRFAETEEGIFYSDISPKNNVLPLLADHFADRYSVFPWVIHDVDRGLALVYNMKECLFTNAPKTANVRLSPGESLYQALWQTFYDSIKVESRRNYKLQRQNMPLHFRRHMTEHKNARGQSVKRPPEI